MSNRQLTYSGIRFFCAIAAAILLAACAAQTWTKPTIAPLENQLPFEVADQKILGVSEEMKQFLDLHVPNNLNRTSKAFALAYASMDPNFLHFDYDPSKTLGAEDAFAQKTGNCLSFSNMFIAMAREAGMQAWYQEVEVPTEWSSVNETLLISRHVNAVAKDTYMDYVIDVSRKYRAEETTSRKISDREALAQFYNNLGVDALIDSQLPAAYAYFVKAIETYPNRAFFWSNLAVAYRRNGQTGDAEATYLTAIRLDSDETVALNNLYSIYTEQGNEAAARELRPRVDRHRRKNPYYLQQLSVEAVEEGRYDDAVRLIRQAIRIKEEEYRFHVTLASYLALSGEEDKALKSLERARQLAPSSSALDEIELIEFGDS
jgi:Flp pilus assembly protein TadD